MTVKRFRFGQSVALVMGGAILGYWLSLQHPEVSGKNPKKENAAGVNNAHAVVNYAQQPHDADDMRQSPGANVDRGDYDWGLGDGHISKLTPYPQPCREGDRTPFDLWSSSASCWS